jgi:hypothetical protein
MELEQYEFKGIPKPRGRPRKARALSNKERQKRHRAKIKANHVHSKSAPLEWVKLGPGVEVANRVNITLSLSIKNANKMVNIFRTYKGLGLNATYEGIYNDLINWFDENALVEFIKQNH